MKISRKQKPKNKSKKGKASNIFKSIGGTLGEVALPGVGGLVGSMVGNYAGKAFDLITGAGAYEVKENSITSGGVTFAKSSPTRFTHREFLMDVQGWTGVNFPTGDELYDGATISGAPRVFRFPINPFYSGTFPWLSTVSGAFEEYRLHGCVLEYRPTSGSATGSNTALGSVIMVTEYDTSKHYPFGTFPNKQKLENHEFAISIVPSESAIHPIECAKNETAQSDHRYIRSKIPTLAELQSNPIYDWGNFFIVTYGQQQINVIGELWISYDIEFFKPKQKTQTTLGDVWEFSDCTISNPCNNPVPSFQSIGTTVSPGGVVTFPSSFYGQIQITFSIQNAALGGAPSSMTEALSSTITQVSEYEYYNAVAISDITGSIMILDAFYNVTGGGTITFTATGLPDAPNSGEMIISYYPSI